MESMIAMYEEIRKQFFPMALPSGVTGRAMDQDAAQEPIQAIAHLIFPPGFRQVLGLFAVPEARRERIERLREVHTRSHPEWVVFYSDRDEPVGWFYGYMEDEETFFIDTIGLVPAFRGRGIYTAFLRQLIAYLRAIGYERLATTHHPNNRAALIADLKAGFDIVGLELHESHGPMLKTATHLREDRRQAFERVFSMEPEKKRQETGSAFPLLETARLRLRQPSERDAQQLLAVTRDDAVMRYYGMEPFASEQEALQEINWFNDQFEKGKGIRWVITVKPQDEYIGDVGFGFIPQHARAELGFKLARAYWRQGMMTEAINRVIAYGFEIRQVNRFEALVDPQNVACVGLLESLRFRRDGLLREYEFEKGAFVDLAMYSLLKSDVLQSRATPPKKLN